MFTVLLCVCRECNPQSGGIVGGGFSIIVTWSFMEVIIQPEAESAAERVVDFIAKELTAKPNAVLGLATGRTMEIVYRQLVRRHRETGLDFSRCRTFNLDEYVGLSADHFNSYSYFMRDRLFSRVNINTHSTHLLNGAAENLEQECARYEKLISESGGIDLLLLGIGLNGHLGFNEPLSEFDSRTRMMPLTQTTRRQNAGLFAEPEQVPQWSLTMGVGTILEARRCLLLATGSEKAAVVAQAVEGPITTRITASALQWHPACTVVLDEAAAGQLSHPSDYSSKKADANGVESLSKSLVGGVLHPAI
jgi:glucosamine-6-phosphate deaminase